MNKLMLVFQGVGHMTWERLLLLSIPCPSVLFTKKPDTKQTEPTTASNTTAQKLPKPQMKVQYDVTEQQVERANMVAEDDVNLSVSVDWWANLRCRSQKFSIHILSMGRFDCICIRKTTHTWILPRSKCKITWFLRSVHETLWTRLSHLFPCPTLYRTWASSTKKTFWISSVNKISCRFNISWLKFSWSLHLFIS